MMFGAQDLLMGVLKVTLLIPQMHVSLFHIKNIRLKKFCFNPLHNNIGKSDQRPSDCSAHSKSRKMPLSNFEVN